MKTSYWFGYKGEGRIGISRGVPRNSPAGFRLFKPLYPDADMLKMAKPEYDPRYEAILARLDPQATWDELHKLAGGAEPVLLCWESLQKDGEFCHRTAVARWFERTLGHEVLEIQPTPRIATKKAAPPPAAEGSLI